MSTIRKITIVGLLLTGFLLARASFVVTVAHANGDGALGSAQHGNVFDGSHDGDHNGGYDNSHNGDHDCGCGKNASSSCATLTVMVNVVNAGGGTKSASDFTVTVSGTNSSSSTFPGSASGTKVSIGLGTYQVGQAADPNYITSLSADCSGVMAKGNTKTCTITDTFIPPSTPTSTAPITVVATKVICPSVSELPDWGLGGNTITSSTASAFLASHPDCHVAAGWDFQWGFPSVTNPGGDFVGSAPSSSGWTTFGPTGANGQTTLQISDMKGNSYIWVREALQSGYLHFTYPADPSNNPDSAEMFCHVDALNYDNYDRVDNPVPGGTYYCVAWNVPTATSTPTSTVPSADISIVKTADATSTVEGGTVHYTLTVTASGPATSTGVVATDTLPTSLTFVNATTSVGSYASSTGIWTIGDLSANATATLKIAATVNAGAAGTTITNTAIVGENASTTDPDLGNNTSLIPVIIATSTCTTNCGGGSDQADIAIAKTVDNANPNGGDTINYTLTVTALGPATSTLVKANDILPSGLSLVSVTSSQGLYNMSTGGWDIGTLNPNATATLVIAAMVDSREAGQTIANTATVSELSSLVDNSANNSSSISIAVRTPPCTSNCGGNSGGGITVSTGGGMTVLTGGGGSAYNIAINSGAISTATTSVALSLYGTEAYTMELSNTPDFASSTWEPYVTTKAWVITSGAGSKTVYVKYRSVGGNALGGAQASIQLLGQAPAGQVLGTSTSCGIYLNDYIKLGAKNNPDEVKKLQAFLNQNLGINLPTTGYYGPLTQNAVNQFQLKYNGNVLAPWVPYGLANDTTATGYVYKTTRRWINMLMCSSLNLPIPQLP